MPFVFALPVEPRSQSNRRVATIQGHGSGTCRPRSNPRAEYEALPLPVTDMALKTYFNLLEETLVEDSKMAVPSAAIAPIDNAI
jgi:hypothetical protein